MRTVSSLGAHCLAAVTAVTFQNTSGYAGTEPLRPKSVRRQIESVLEDFEIGAVKVGMVYNSGIISSVARCLAGVEAPIVADPVMASTTGGTLLKKGAVAKYAKKILPLAHVATPNMAEAESLSGVGRGAGARAVASAIAGMGARNVVITGVRRGRRVRDYLLESDSWSSMSSPALDFEVHGSGCAFASSMAVFLAGGDGVRKSLVRARRHARAAMEGASGAGRGLPAASADKLRARLAEAVAQFVAMPGAESLIPECRTNFVFAKKGARSSADVLAVDGRITRTLLGPSAGRLAYGASEHVSAALLEVSREFPLVRSAANIRYDGGVAARMGEAGLSAALYDRSREPADTKARGSSVRWGVRAALRGARGPPDAICHGGDAGKEPMAVVFGEDPESVLGKLRRCL